jgi:hypothetical protein
VPGVAHMVAGTGAPGDASTADVVVNVTVPTAVGDSGAAVGVRVLANASAGSELPALIALLLLSSYCFCAQVAPACVCMLILSGARLPCVCLARGCVLLRTIRWHPDHRQLHQAGSRRQHEGHGLDPYAEPLWQRQLRPGLSYLSDPQVSTSCTGQPASQPASQLASAVDYCRLRSRCHVRVGPASRHIKGVTLD